MHKKVEAALRSSERHFRVHLHAKLDRAVKGPQDFADALGYDLPRIAKTVFVRSASGDGFGVVVCSMGKKIDLPLVAQKMGCRRVEVAYAAELKARLDYPPNGVSPLGAEGNPVFIDRGLFGFPTILVGGGQAGVEVEISASDLQEITRASVLDLAI